MPDMQDNSREQLVMRTAGIATAVLILLTLALSWQFNIIHDAVFFLRAALFILLALALLWRLCLHISQPWLRAAVAVIGAEALGIYAAGRLISFYYQGESFNEEFFFHFNPETLKFALSAFLGLAVLAFAYMGLVAAGSYFAIYRAQALALDNRTLLIWPALVVALALDPDLGRLASLSMADANTNRGIQLSTIDWEDTGLNRDALYKRVDEITAGKNVVMIYLEGLEKMYTDESLYPGLTPFLNSLEGRALQFEDMRQTRGTTFTVAGILSSQCGTPLLFPSGPGGNDILKNGFLQEGNCLGDILATAGYRQVFMGGASTRFAGKGLFLSAHGYEEVYGLEELRPLMSDPAYLNNWGLFDDTLLELAAAKFDELAADRDRPFNFTVLTVDTHPPDGTVSRSCTPYPAIDNNIFHAIHCTDQLVARFIDHLQQSPAWDDTVVLLMSDHLHMRNTGMDYYPVEYERRLLVNILNAGAGGDITTPGTHMDVAPTLLNLMGVRHSQQFLAGSDMLAPDKATRWIDPDYNRRVAAIRYINTNLLSRIETGLCEADPIYSFTGDTLRIAGRDIDLSLQGRPMPLELVGTTNALMTLVSREGKVGLTFPVDLDSLSYVMFQFRRSSYFLLAPGESLARQAPGVEAFEGLGLVFGNLQDAFEPLATGISLEEGFEIQADCGDLLATSRALEEELSGETLGKICDFRVPEGTLWEDSRGRIRLNSVAYANQRYTAELARDSRGWYAVTNLSALDPEPPPDSCDAYYGAQEILIPGMQSEDGPVSMILRKIPGVTLTFEVDTVVPLPAGG